MKSCADCYHMRVQHLVARCTEGRFSYPNGKDREFKVQHYIRNTGRMRSKIMWREAERCGAFEGMDEG